MVSLDKVNIRAYIWFLAFLFCFACKKKDTVPPVVSLSSPSGMSAHDVLDYIRVTGTVTDDSDLEWIKIKVQSVQGLSATETTLLNPSGSSFDFDEYIHLEDIHLSSGSYYVKVTAFDGVNESSEFVEVILNEVPRVLEKVLITSDGVGSVELFELDNSNFSYLDQMGGDYSSSVANSYWHYIAIAGDEVGGMRAYDPISKSVLWEVSNGLIGSTFFRYLTVGESNNIFITQGDGNVKSFDKNGIRKFLANVGINSNLGYVKEIGGAVFVEVISNLGSVDLVRFNSGTGIEESRLSLNERIIGIEQKGGGELYLITQDSGQPRIYIFSVMSNSLWEPIQLPSGSVYSTLGVSNNEVWLGHSTGVLRYVFNTAGAVAMNSIVAADLDRENISGVIYAVGRTKCTYVRSVG